MYIRPACASILGLIKKRIAEQTFEVVIAKGIMFTFAEIWGTTGTCVRRKAWVVKPSNSQPILVIKIALVCHNFFDQMMDSVVLQNGFNVERIGIRENRNVAAVRVDPFQRLFHFRVLFPVSHRNNCYSELIFRHNQTAN
jgi:hypothetical protein